LPPIAEVCTTVNIETFDDLLRAARTQARPQRLLFVFAGVTAPDDPTPAQRAAFEAGAGGALEPLMCVAKDPATLPNFGLLVEEARQFADDWRFVFCAAMDAADEAATDAALKRLVNAVREGRLAGLLPLDRDGCVRALQAG
jgi:hypothetical protein